jgi:predicted DNA-binding transcriptional regulator AlpA
MLGMAAKAPKFGSFVGVGSHSGMGETLNAKREKFRYYAPDYVSADTLAYRLDCSRSTIDDYVRRGLLPPPQVVGNLQRWRWSDVEDWIAVHSGLDDANSSNRNDEEDAYFAGVKRVTTSEA